MSNMRVPKIKSRSQRCLDGTSSLSSPCHRITRFGAQVLNDDVAKLDALRDALSVGLQIRHVAHRS